HPPSISGCQALINGIILAGLGLYSLEAVETPQRGDEIIVLCGIVHGSDMLRYRSFGWGCIVPRVAPPPLPNLLGLKSGPSLRDLTRNLPPSAPTIYERRRDARA